MFTCTFSFVSAEHFVVSVLLMVIMKHLGDQLITALSRRKLPRI